MFNVRKSFQILSVISCPPPFRILAFYNHSLSCSNTVCDYPFATLGRSACAGRLNRIVSIRYATASQQKEKTDYPEETNGTRWAAEARKMASKLTSEEEAEHFRQAMVKIYGGQPKKATGIGR
ncbi:MAG TPA: hypothetical protein VF437_08220 [Verrucomicrobiae bacterium]